MYPVKPHNKAVYGINFFSCKFVTESMMQKILKPSSIRTLNIKHDPMICYALVTAGQ